MQCQIALGFTQRILRDAARDSQATVIAHNGANGGTSCNAVGCCVSEANFFENAEDVVDDRREGLVGERFVAAAALTGPHGLHGFF